MNNVKKLPDSYLKSTDSNNYKLLNLNELAIADIKVDVDAVFASLDLDNATGYTLDLYGNIVGQKRGTLNDEQYRYMIYTKIAINTVRGDYESTINALAHIFKCKTSDIILRDGEAPCSVEVQTFPLAVLVNAGFTSKQALELIAELLPAGISVDAYNFIGTFEFAETADEYDESAGFADAEQTMGGFFGLLLGEDEESPVLPI